MGRRVPYLLGGSILVSLGIVGIGFAPTFWFLFAVWLFLQANINVSYGPYQALIQDLVPGTRTGVASAFKILADVVGGVAFIKISTVFMGWYEFGDSIEWLWITLGVLGINLLVTASITSATVLARQGKPGSELKVDDRLPPKSSGLHPQLKLFLISRWFMMTAIVVFQTYGLFFIRDKVGLEAPLQALGNMVLVIGVAVAVGAYMAGWFSDRLGRKPVVLAGASGASVSTVALLWAGSTPEILVVATFIGFSVGTLLSSNWALANEMGTTGQEALHMGVVNLATIGGAASAKLLGPGVDLLNRVSPTLGYSALIVGCAILLVLGGVFLIPFKTEQN